MNVRDREKWKFLTTLKLYSLSCFVTVITIKMIYTLVQCQSGTEKHWDCKPLLGKTLQPAEARATSCLDADNAHLPAHVEMLSFQLCLLPFTSTGLGSSRAARFWRSLKCFMDSTGNVASHWAQKLLWRWTWKDYELQKKQYSTTELGGAHLQSFIYKYPQIMAIKPWLSNHGYQKNDVEYWVTLFYKVTCQKQIVPWRYLPKLPPVQC